MYKYFFILFLFVAATYQEMETLKNIKDRNNGTLELMKGSGIRTFVYDRATQSRFHVSDALIAEEHLRQSVKILSDTDILSIKLVGYIHRSGWSSVTPLEASRIPTESVDVKLQSISDEKTIITISKTSPVYYKTSNEGLSSVMKQIEIIYNVVRSVNRLKLSYLQKQKQKNTLVLIFN